MTNQRAYYYPAAKKEGYGNPYSINYKDALNQRLCLLDAENTPVKMLTLALFINSFKADLYVINWLENVGFARLHLIQYFLARLSLYIIRLRKKKIVWMFHNIHPHAGENHFSRMIQKYLFKHADLIVSHSQEAADYARLHTSTEVLYICHPINPLKMQNTTVDVPMCDVFIWGTILPYKGVYEFIEQVVKRNSSVTVHILGLCKDKELSENINKYSSGNIVFENRRADFEEIAAYINNSKYVLFPYVGNCVSSSGALMDTLVMGGTPVGPTVGAFKDLSEESMCMVYHDYDELFHILDGDCRINESDRKSFFERNSWKSMIDTIVDKINNIEK